MRGLAVFTGLFVPVWWAWWGFTWYSAAFNDDDAVNRVALFCGMAGVAALATRRAVSSRSAIECVDDFLERAGAGLDQHEYASVVERADVGIGGRFVEPCLDERLS